MKKLIFFSCFTFFFLKLTAQVTNTRTAKPDTSKPGVRPVNPNARLSIPGLKSAAKGTSLNKNQVPVLGIDSNLVYFSDDARFPKMTSDLTSNSLTSDYRFTPKQSYINEENHLIYSTARTEITAAKQRWELLRDFYRKEYPRLSFLVRLQPAKDYLIIIEANLLSNNLPLSLAFNTMIGKNHFTTHWFPAATGKNEFTAILHTRPDYEFVKLGTSCSCINLTVHVNTKKGTPDPQFAVEITSIRIKEIKL